MKTLVSEFLEFPIKVRCNLQKHFEKFKQFQQLVLCIIIGNELLVNPKRTMVRFGTT